MLGVAATASAAAGEERVRTNDTIAGALLIALAALLLALTLNIPPFPGQKYGPSLFPRLLGAGLILCGALLILRGRRERRPGLVIAGWAGERWRVVSFALVPAVPMIAILGWERIGFVPLTLVSLGGLFVWFRVRPATAVITAIVATVLLQIFFGKLLRVPLPLGWLLNLPPHWLKYIT
jgi:putative tricarboxylic transport membrane protein